MLKIGSVLNPLLRVIFSKVQIIDTAGLQLNPN